MALPRNNNDELLTCLAALALYDGDAEVSAAQINTLLTATGNTVAPYWPTLFSGFLKDNMETLLFSLGGPAAGAAAAAPAGEAAADAGEAKQSKKEEEVVEEVDLGGGMDMFGGGDGGSY